MGEMIQFPRPDGQQAPGYLAHPAAGRDEAPAVVVIQEWWGLGAQIKGVADRLAAAGYRALAPDLYRGKLTTSPDEAARLMGTLDWGAAAEQDVRGAAQHLRQAGGKVGVLGFCMGGALTVIASVKVPELDAGVCFYGIPPEAVADPRRIRVPLIAHFANKDDWCTPQAVDQFERALQEAKVAHEVYRYDAQHAFFNEHRPDVYDTRSAQSAWDRSLTFLKRHLG
jgi:carboxymethylenebutenolidase